MYPLIDEADIARMAELKLSIHANEAARAHSRNAIVRRHCTQRIDAAQDELRSLNFLVELAAR